MADKRKKSEYASKQGRARKSSGDDHDGPRTRYATTSPLSADYVMNPAHRLALYFARGERLEREQYRGAPYGRHRVERGRFVPRVALP